MARKNKHVGIYFFSVLTILLLLVFFVRCEWFMIHISVDWKKLAPTIGSVRFVGPILVIESDDWGVYEGESSSVAKSYRDAGYEIPYYAEYSALETPEEVNCMVNMLLAHKDSRSKPAVLTANMIMANIDFEAVRESNLTEFVLLALDSNSPRNPVSKCLVSEYISGMESGVFWPQLHGLCHINKNAWLKGLKENEPFATKAFFFNSTPLGYAGEGVERYSSVYSDFSVTPSASRTYESQLEDISEAVTIFQRIFKFMPKSTIAPFYVWDANTEKAFRSVGIRYIQAGNMQVFSKKNNGELLRKYHSLGQVSENGLLYLTRDIPFEPQKSKSSMVASIKRRIGWRFFVGRPAVISTHRINYVGTNAGKHREQLDELLNYAELKFPDLLYMSSDELGRIIEGGDMSLIVKKHSPKHYVLVVKDILLHLPGVWYPVLFAINGSILLFLIYRRLRHSSLKRKK
jgi:hypothetical protein